MSLRIKFEKLVLKNFLSYEDAVIELGDRGFCSIKGINNYMSDNAISNGSGKSSWVSALCYALTGQTVQGVTKDIKNIYIDEDACWVELYFKVDSNDYHIIRYSRPKSDLKIYVNGEDKSGKGIRESELQLQELLPDLSRDLLISVIILGQGLPDKLSSKTPSGRKDLLEKLSNSDFMIQDVKNRIEARECFWGKICNDCNEALVSNKSKTSVYENQIKVAERELFELENINYDEEIKQLGETLHDTQSQIDFIKEELSVEEAEAEKTNNFLLKINDEKQIKVKEEADAYNKSWKDLNTVYTEESSQIKQLEGEINKLKNIKDLCPTCGQKIPGVVKPNTEMQENDLIKIKEKHKITTESLNNLKVIHDRSAQSITESFKQDLHDLNIKLESVKRVINAKKTVLDTLFTQRQSAENSYNRMLLNKENLLSSIQKIAERKKEFENNIKQLNIQIKEIAAKQDEAVAHIEIIKRMSTLIKRDFRGYLLTNVISFIDRKAKDYCLQVFEHNNISFELNGNNIDIYFSQKPYEVLSGGEKQKVDLVIQFALRNMLTKYFNFESNVLFLDEVTDNLDERGCNKIFNLISSNLCDIESVYIISHHESELNLPIDTEMVVIKDERGISTIR